MNWPTNTNTSGKSTANSMLRLLGAIIMAAMLYGCGNSVENNPEIVNGGGNSCSGATDVVDCEAFRTSLWDPYLRANCNGCHELGGNGNGTFADRNVVIAYEAIQDNHRVNPDDPANSYIVTRVQGIHNCWVNIAGQTETENCAASASLLLTGINNWVNPTGQPLQSGSGDGDVVSKLVNPSIDSPPVADPIVLDSTNTEQINIFRTNLFAPILRQRCSNCHSEGAVQAQRQTPYFAQNVGTVEEDDGPAYAALVDNRKIDINNPENSRLYLRLAQDAHNCWTDCATDAQTMLTAINNMKTALEAIAPPPVVEGLLSPNETTSQALALDQGQVVSGGTRVTSGLVALWEFKEGTGSVAHDSSGVSPLIDLVLNENTDWVGGWGIEFNDGGHAIASSIADSEKLHNSIVANNEFTIEGWVVPANVTQEGPAIIASYSFSESERNFSLGQTLYSYEFLNRNTASGLDITNRANGQPTLITNPDDEDLQATQQHVVITYDSTNGRRIYVNGQFTGDIDTVTGGNLAEWDDGYVFVLGSDIGDSDGSTQWLGKIRLMAIYNRALTQDEITQNFDAGVGQQFQLLFKVGHLSDSIPETSYIWFEVGEFDDYSYLFSNPRFVVLDPVDSGTALTPTSISDLQIQGLRIGVNGKLPTSGQAFLNMDRTINMPNLTDAANDRSVSLIAQIDGVIIDGASIDNVPVSATGTIIAKERGPNTTPPDQFYLTFESFDGATGVQSDNGTPIPLTYSYSDPESGLANSNFLAGIRTFEEINATMAELTDISITDSAVQPTFLELQQQLPNNPALQGFLASHQMGISKLALTYCGELVDNPAQRNDVFGAAASDLATVFDTTANQTAIVDALYNQMIGQNIASQPPRSEVSNLLIGSGGLLEQLSASCSGSCGATRNATILKSMCVSVLSSAAVTTQ